MFDKLKIREYRNKHLAHLDPKSMQSFLSNKENIYHNPDFKKLLEKLSELLILLSALVCNTNYISLPRSGYSPKKIFEIIKESVIKDIKKTKSEIKEWNIFLEENS